MQDNAKERLKEKKPTKRQREARCRVAEQQEVVQREEEQQEVVQREEEQQRQLQQQEEEVVRQRQVEGEEENLVPAVLDPLEKGFLAHAQREEDRMKERLLKRTYSKKNKTMVGGWVAPVVDSEIVSGLQLLVLAHLIPTRLNVVQCGALSAYQRPVHLHPASSEERHPASGFLTCFFFY
ncbi:hypothetical protein NHX12_025616 [Muraenolepis orangiensis]|uniref:Uncharacterized protein n=1 Tax=Muraenolepis orangiensis TaxID=630683 RepID=A0A9Q0EK85_9TELE|nr:hypothetical protein NHX12_025616 [Muraenolepis orangiensis]